MQSINSLNKYPINLDNKVMDFIQRNNINRKEVEDCLEYIESKFSKIYFEFDTEIYWTFWVLKLSILYNSRLIQPRLFWTLENLANLNNIMWQKATVNWADIMEDISNRWTFLKKVILTSKLIEIIKRFYQQGDKIIDIWCWDWVFIKELLENFNNIFGVDWNNKFISFLKQKYSDIADNFEEQDILYNNPNHDFDIAVCSMLLLDIPDINKALDSIFETIKNNWILIIADINSKYYKALWYFDENKLIEVYNRKEIFHTEKMISWHTKAVYNYHPFNYYRQYLEDKWMMCIEDFELWINKDNIINYPDLKEEDKQRLLKEFEIEYMYPTFHVLVFKKESPNYN